MPTYLLVFLCLTTTLTAQEAGIDFFTGSWSEALSRAEAEDKLIFVDAYAEWCGPCKVMSARVFPDGEVGAYFNANFINVKLDMEKPESEDFRQWHAASAYPTLLFIDAQNEVVHRLVGARDARQLLRDAAGALARTENLEDLQAAYTAGKPGAAFKYVRALIRNGEPHLRVANDYLRRPGVDFTAPATLRLVYRSATEADSRIYDLLLAHRTAIDALEGEGAVATQARKAVRATFDKSLEYRDGRLLAAAVEKLSNLDKEEGKRLESEGEFAFALAGTDRKAVEKATKSYLKKGAAGDADRLRALFASLEATEFMNYGEIIDLGVEALTAAAELGVEGWRDDYRLARFLQSRERHDQALKIAGRALERFGDGPDNYRRAIQGLIDELKAAAN